MAHNEHHLDPRIPPREQCVLRYALEYWAGKQPYKVFSWFNSDLKWTYKDTLNIVRRAGAAFHNIGISQYEHVLVWLPSGTDMLKVWFGLNWIGAVFVPINTNYKGSLLQNAVEKSDARRMVIHRDLVKLIEGISPARLETLIVVGGTDALIAPHDLELLDGTLLDTSSESYIDPETPIEPWHTQSIIYTSGTTGPSKAVLSSYLHLWSTGGPEAWAFVDGNDRMLVTLPMFHVGGTLPVNAMLCRGGSIAIIDYFKTDTFWGTVCDSRSTTTILVSAMLVFLLKKPEQSNDQDHTLRKVIAVPVQEATWTFGSRFGVTIYTGYNMTEISTPICSGPNPNISGLCGTVRKGVEVRIVDENDCEIPVGEVGELILRTDCPWALNSGYYKDPEATARAWRNGWFHTGDAFRKNNDGQYFFIDRKKDAIRRRGENISSFEVEGEACAHPNVREAAAVGVPSDLSEEDILLVVSPTEGKTIDPSFLIDFMAERMAHFMVPRFVRIIDELPKTPTGKVEKSTLRKQGVTKDTWDREIVGKKIKRHQV